MSDIYTDRRYGRPVPATSFSDKRPVHPEYEGAKCGDWRGGKACGRKAIGIRTDLGAGHWSQETTTPVCGAHKTHHNGGGQTRPLPRMERGS